MSDIFKFKQFELNQKDSPLKVGTDAMLLGALAKPGKAQNILDIGTGTGVLSLMLAQQCPLAIIDAVEIDPIAALRAKENFENSPWAYRLSVYEQALQDYMNIDVLFYEYIVCNPPYFKPSPTTRKDRVIAKSTTLLTHEVLIEYAEKLLDARGILGLILPASAVSNVVQIALQYKLHLQRRVNISSFATTATIRCVVEFCKQAPQVVVEENLFIYNVDKSWSDDYTLITQQFHNKQSR